MDQTMVPSVDESYSVDTRTEEKDMNSPPPRKELRTKASLMIMMVEHDDVDDEDESPKELDQATMSSMCMLPAEIALREQARQLSEMSMKDALAEAFIESETRRMSLIAIHSAFSAAAMLQPEGSRPAKRKPNFFRRFVSCCFSCFGRRSR
ncbi:uncharacterized protein LOC133196300 [Saccostrea echinata]|uniref:uncharacterized protein LOC133196300 n=1 Tax=Saccostrea echinata TaxID=191078 RepID=UPI002A7FC9FD|nr:uncharacterized protein LOC133196300 [Saccostrea echinata]